MTGKHSDVKIPYAGRAGIAAVALATAATGLAGPVGHGPAAHPVDDHETEAATEPHPVVSVVKVPGVKPGPASLPVVQPTGPPALTLPAETARPAAQIPVTPPAASAPPEPVSAPPATSAGFGAALVRTVATQAGVPYAWGGEDPAGFDCSGLVQWAYRRLGRSIPRTTQAQYEASAHVAVANAEVGDLIFFGIPSAIYHVGVYAGGGTMWAAPRPGKTVQLQIIWTTNYYVGRL